jgi:phage-related protein
MEQEIEHLRWMGSSLKDLKSFPPEVRSAAQNGELDPAAKPLKGFAGASVIEIVARFSGDTWRVVYTVRFTSAIYVAPSIPEEIQIGRGHSEERN